MQSSYREALTIFRPLVTKMTSCLRANTWVSSSYVKGLQKKVGKKYPPPHPQIKANSLKCVQNCGQEEDVTVQIWEKSWLSYNSGGNYFWQKSSLYVLCLTCSYLMDTYLWTAFDKSTYISEHGYSTVDYSLTNDTLTSCVQKSVVKDRLVAQLVG